MDSVYLHFTAVGRDLAFPVAAIAEVVALPRLMRPPATPPLVEGIMNLRGQPVPVILLSLLLDLPRSPQGPFTIQTAFTTAIVFKPGIEGGWAAQADRVLDVVTWPDSTVGPAPADLAFNDCVAGIRTEADGRMVPVLSPERLLERRERLILAAYRDRAQQRQELWRIPS